MIIERHNGQLAASSGGETGAVFQIVLPAALEDQPVGQVA
jgi:signal transduction histidine kinase